MNESINVFDTSDALTESDGPPTLEAEPRFEAAAAPVEDAVEPDYFVVEEPRRGRPSFLATALATLLAGAARRRAFAALALLGAAALIVSLLGSASSSGGAAPTAATGGSAGAARVEAATPTPARERRVWVRSERRALRSELGSEAVAPAQVALPGRKPPRSHPKRRAAPVRHTPVEAEPEPAPAPEPEPETSYYAPPPEPAPAPASPPPAPSSSAGSEEFGIEP